MSSYLAQIKTLKPELFKNLKITNSEWYGMKNTLKNFVKDNIALYRFSDLTRNLCIISARTISIDKNGIVLGNDFELTYENKIPLPESRRF